MDFDSYGSAVLEDTATERDVNTSRKIRVLFPYVEAGFGHIMPMKSIIETFRDKYGDKVEVISSRFYTETGDRHMRRYEQNISEHVRMYNHLPVYGYLATFLCQLSSKASSFCAVRLISPVAYKKSVLHMMELKPDVVFSTHWATNYYAEHMESKPLTVMYCPDAQLNKLFEYHSDYSMISMPYGYEKALRKKQYNVNNMKLVPFLIRNEAFDVDTDKKAARRRLGLPENNFTVLLAEGGYGIGKMTEICKRLVREHVPLTVIPVCGKNKKLLDKLTGLKTTEEVTFRPYGFTTDIFELDAASDIFCGKSGNILAEATFFGNPSIVTNCTTMIEHNIADHYINTVGCAIKELSPKKTVELIKMFASDSNLLEPYRKSALAYHDRFGSEQAADELWKIIKQTYPEFI